MNPVNNAFLMHHATWKNMKDCAFAFLPDGRVFRVTGLEIVEFVPKAAPLPEPKPRPAHRRRSQPLPPTDHSA